MARLRSPESLEKVRQEYTSGDTDKKLWAFHIPAYQRNILKIIGEDNGASMAEILRSEIDDMIVELIEGLGQE